MEHRDESAVASPAERVFAVAAALAVLDCVYVTWRYLVLHAGLAAPRTGLCSLSREAFLLFEQGVDCDPVLLSPQARAFYVPNATLGLGFFLGCAVFWARCRRDPATRAAAVALLRPWLLLATAFTFYFYSLLVHLPTLCPVCPWNHLLTWVMAAAVIAMGREVRPVGLVDAVRVARAGVVPGVAIFVGAQMLWAVPWSLGRLTP